MSGARYIKQAIIAALCEHPDHDKYKTRAFSGDNLQEVMNAFNVVGSKITKADFFAPDDEGVYLIDTPGFWRNFDKIRDIIHSAGDVLKMEDFTKPLGKDETRTLLESATLNNGLGKVFSQDVWAGRFDEMERLWYKVRMSSRRDLFKNDGLLSPVLKKQMLAAEGRDMPEERLEKAGVTLFDLKSAFVERGNYEEVSRKLAQNGDWMRKEYLLLPDNSGDTAFYYPGVWDKYNELVEGMKAHGEKMQVPDFLRQVGNVHNPLARAAERRALDKVFNPDHWTDRLPEMLDLWSHVLPGWKTGSMTVKDFDKSYSKAESLTYGKMIDFKTLDSKAALVKELNEPSAQMKAVIPLGLKAFWENYEAVQQKLTAQGEKITTADMRLKSGQMDDTCLMSAVKFGHFSDVALISRRSAQPLTLDDYMSKDRHGNSLLNILAEKNELAQVFSPDLWVGRVSDMNTLWSHVRISDRAQVDILQVEVAVKQATLKQASKGNKFKL